MNPDIFKTQSNPDGVIGHIERENFRANLAPMEPKRRFTGGHRFIEKPATSLSFAFDCPKYRDGCNDNTCIRCRHFRKAQTNNIILTACRQLGADC